MAEIKVNIGDSKSKKTYNKTLNEEQVAPIYGKKIGDIITGEVLDLAGYEFEVMGGSDNAGFPMRKDVQGAVRSKVLIVTGVGVRKQSYKGSKRRKSVAGNTIYERTAQINLKVTKWGKDPIEAPAAEPAAEEGEAKAEE